MSDAALKADLKMKRLLMRRNERIQNSINRFSTGRLDLKRLSNLLEI